MSKFTILATMMSLTTLTIGCAHHNREVTGTAARDDLPASLFINRPDEAKPGECYARVYYPAVYRSEVEQVVKQAASERIDIVSAQYEQIEERDVVKPATTRMERVPATFDTVEEQVMVRPATTRLEQVPAEYETVSERVAIKPATQVWRKASEGNYSDVQRVDPVSGDVYCLIEIPAEFREVSKQVVKTPATTREVQVPAEYQSIRKVVEKTPASTREVRVPAEYENVQMASLVSAAREQRVDMPAQYESVPRTVLVEAEVIQWRQVVCADNANKETISKVQESLRAAGYDPGDAAGVLNKQTREALNAYQQANDLPVDQGPYVNVDTTKSLGLKP